MSTQGKNNQIIIASMLVKNIRKVIALLQPMQTLQFCFSVHNYMKTFQKEQVTRYHGHFRVDEYQHFDQDTTAVAKFVQEERNSFEKQSAKWKQITDEYYEISSARRDSRNSSVPQKIDGFQYFMKVAWKDSRDYSTIYRRKPGESQQLVLDIMSYPFINKYYQTAELLATAFSPSHNLVAFAVDLKNNQKSSFFIAKTTGRHELISIGQSSRNKMLQNAHDLVFASQEEIYFLKSQNRRPCKLCYMNIKTGQSKQLFEQQNQEFYLGLKRSKDKNYLLVSAVSKNNSKLWVLDIAQKGKLIKVWQGAGKVYINHIKNYFVVWHAKQYSQVKLISDSSIKTLFLRQSFDLSKITGEVIYRSGDEQVVQDIDLFDGKIVLYGYNITNPTLKILTYNQQQDKIKTAIRTAQLPYKFGTVSPCSNQDYHSDSVLFAVSTPFVYEQIYSYNFEEDRVRLERKYQHTGPPIQADRYEVSIVDVPATDGQLIPLTIIASKKKIPSKLILNFYGCYGLPTRVGYDNTTIAALQKGWTICHAHVRGGNEKGKKWHTQSQGDNRIRSWLDVQQCVGYLLRQNYTHPSLLFLSSSSAGAINLWNVISRKPYLYKGAIFRMPFLDVLSSLLDPTQPLSSTDYEEFGNPIQHPVSYRRISAFSPYQNISNQEYPALHFVAGQNDYRTPVSQLAKFVSRLRDRKSDNGRLGQLGIKGVTVDISKSGSHLGQANIHDQNYKGCDIYGYMDYIINSCSKDCIKQ